MTYDSDTLVINGSYSHPHSYSFNQQLSKVKATSMGPPFFAGTKSNSENGKGKRN